MSRFLNRVVQNRLADPRKRDSFLTFLLLQKMAPLFEVGQDLILREPYAGTFGPRPVAHVAEIPTSSADIYVLSMTRDISEIIEYSKWDLFRFYDGWHKHNRIPFKVGRESCGSVKLSRMETELLFQKVENTYYADMPWLLYGSKMIYSQDSSLQSSLQGVSET